MRPPGHRFFLFAMTITAVPFDRQLEEWRTADLAAAAAEGTVVRAVLSALPAPQVQILRDNAERLRALADKRYAAMTQAQGGEANPLGFRRQINGDPT